MIHEKIQQAMGILKEKEIDLWLTYVKESHIRNDPVLEYIVGAGVTWPTAFMITAAGEALAITGKLDIPNIEKMDIWQIIPYSQSFQGKLLSTIEKIAPRSIAVNFSIHNPAADGLSAGMYLELLDYLKHTPYQKSLRSAEAVISGLRGRKTLAELEKLREAIQVAQEIFRKTAPFIQPGRSEKEVAGFVQEQARERGLALAWDPAHCPAVFTGPAVAGPHAAPTDRKITAGQLVNIDFGVKVAGYCSDLQRTWYVLRPGETQAPPEVQRGFRVLKTAIHKAMAALKPGVKGMEIDRIAREYLVEQGYGGYPHGLGHQVGRRVHDGGALLAPLWEQYGKTPHIPVEADQVYTIEPRLKVPEYGTVTIEEEVLMTKDGCQLLSEPQNELWTIATL